MRTFVGFVFAVLTVASLPAGAASFDCAKATSVVEKLICGDPQASRLDEELAGVYRKALATAPDPAALRREQREWLKVREACATAECLHAAYGDRIAAMKKLASTGRGPRIGAEYPATLVSRSCIPPYSEQTGAGALYKACRVLSAKEIGRTGGQAWHAAIYCLAPRDNAESGCAEARSRNAWANVTVVLVFSRERPDGPLKLALKVEDDDGNSFEGARIHANEHGAILDLAFLVPGTGNLNASHYFLYRDGDWRPIDFASWQNDLHKRLPDGLGVWKGPWPDLGKMVFTSPLWQSKDGNCCPTGGSVHATLGFEGTRLVLRSLKVDRKPLKD